MDLKPSAGRYTTNKVPNQVLWTGMPGDDFLGPNKAYVRAYRTREGHEGPGPYLLLVRYRPGLQGRVVWLCLDTSNGNPELPGGKSWVWLFKTQRQAARQRASYRESLRRTRLSRPYKYMVVDCV